MWITIYFKSGKCIETLIHSFGDLDERYEKEDIMQIDIGCTMLDDNIIKQQEILKLKKQLSKAEEERLTGQGASIDEIRVSLRENI